MACRALASGEAPEEAQAAVEAAKAKAIKARDVLALDIIGLRVCIGSMSPDIEPPGSKFG
jgi:hypothetical protein